MDAIDLGADPARDTEMDQKPLGAADNPDLLESLHACLPTDFRQPTTTFNRIAVGLSGAGVYRVDAAGKSFVLKISGEGESLLDWRRKRHFQQLAARAGLAPAIIHLDEPRRAVLSTFVADRSFPAFYRDPRTHQAALVQLGRTIRRIHELPLSTVDAESKNPREHLAALWPELVANFPLPPFIGDAVRRVLTEEVPAVGRPLVLSHNDVNPTNLVYDGENLLLLDWDNTGPNDPFFDLASISVFLRMDEETCQRLLATYDGEPIGSLPARFAYNRRLVAALCGVTILQLAQRSGHPGAVGGETLESAPALGDVYLRMRSGALNIATGEGQWCFGLALVKASVTY